MRKFGIFIIVFFVLYGVYKYETSGMNQLNEIFKIDALPDNSELLEFYFSGLGIDHHYLWKIDGNKLSNLEIINRINAKIQKKTSSSGCLSLSKKQAPNWWPVDDIEDVLWDSNEPKYELYVKNLQYNSTVCVFNSLIDNTLYIQWFDI
jgi:hypothetical protein